MTLWGCDNTFPASASDAEQTAPKGPPRSAFPESALYTSGNVDDLLSSPSARRAGEDSLVIVALVFDGTDSLYSAEGFNEMMAAAEGGGPAFNNENLYFTDYDTFERVINGGAQRTAEGAPQTGQSYAHLYADGSRHSMPSEAIGMARGVMLMEQPVVYDPYECGDVVPCPGGGTSGGTGGGGGGSSQPYRPATDRTAIRSSSPTWPSVWVGDVVSGEKDCSSSGSTNSGCSSSSGGSSSSSSNLGHDLIITQLDNGGRWGGTFLSPFTRSMEAVGTMPTEAEEVVERTASTWFNVPELTYGMVLYHRNATWAQREAAVAYARAQDPDPYSFLTAKWEEGEWYCSKLIWTAYNVSTGNDLDPNWGYWVSPYDIEHSGHLVTVYHYEHS